MPGLEKLYNMQFLKNTAGLDTDLGLKHNFNLQRTYFKELAAFEKRTTTIINRFFKNPPNSQLLKDLEMLSTFFYRIGDIKFISKIDGTMELIRRNASYPAISDRLYFIQNHVQQLKDMIKQAEILPEAETQKLLEAPKALTLPTEFDVPVKPKILCIDDVPDVLASLKAMLKNDYQVYCVTNHLTAFKFLASNQPDLILLDIEMPDLDGFEVLKLLREINSCKDVPVIFLTGNVNMEYVRASVKNGGSDFVGKPVDYDLLIKKINKHLQR